MQYARCIRRLSLTKLIKRSQDEREKQPKQEVISREGILPLFS